MDEIDKADSSPAMLAMLASNKCMECIFNPILTKWTQQEALVGRQPYIA